jgi:hypothetical protein
MIGGGFTSRCVFVYAHEKSKYVAYPGLIVPKGMNIIEDALVADLEHISVNLCGEYKLTTEAVKWGEEWYQHHFTNKPEGLDDDRFGGYIARKQTHIHKLAMVLAASQRDQLVIETEDLKVANKLVTELERDMPRVFSKIGRTDMSVQAERLLSYVQLRKELPYAEAYRYIHAYFPSMHEYEEVLRGLLSAGYLRLEQRGLVNYLCAVAISPSSVDKDQTVVQFPQSTLEPRRA